MFLVGCRGERVGGDERLLFEEYAFGGFILFRDNCREPRQISSLCGQLWHTTLNTPPFIAIDQEGGRVHRLPSAFTHFPAAAEIGARRDRDLAYRCGRAAATELALVGINLNFAPVLDVNSNPLNPIIGDRSFGNEAGASDRYEFSLAAWPARRRSYPLRQTLSRPWRHRAGFPPGPSRGGKISRRLKSDRAAALRSRLSKWH
jgi:hypothetical protein